MEARMTSKGLLSAKHIQCNFNGFFDFIDKRVTGISTGISSIDREILGLRGIVCIRGAPGTNKSTLSLQIARHYAKHHGPVLFYDRENGTQRLRLRSICQELELSEVDLIVKIKNKQLVEKDLKAVFDTPFFTLNGEEFTTIKDDIDFLIKEYKKPVLLVIDSLQKLPMDLQNRRDSLDEWLHKLDALKVAYEQNLRILFTSEKNYRGYNSPELGGSKDSSEIEYTAENIWDLRHGKNNIILNVAKDRDGAQGFELGLEKVMSDPNNRRSFCYKLKEQEESFDFSQ